MNLEHGFVQVSKLSEDPKKGPKQKWNTFSPNLGEDQKKKKERKGLHQKRNTFFPRIQVDAYAQKHTRVKLLGGCRCTQYGTQTTGGIQPNYWGRYIPPSPPGFRTSVGNEGYW